ncbi:hypothetical protein E1181_08260 [Saccharopolyspora terrae]|uniref:Uncharacterized protein n=1 Tax=Saccharopolyspora terrae TaxID=2530384 RepID=A0A4V2YBL9_9PSEU|nr:hypothetical protein E1181_08260 [Saccharopolyspora terrae]
MFERVQAHPPPRPGDDRERRPPVPVRVDLAAAFAVRPAESGSELPNGWDMQATVDGELVAWRRDTDGRWWGEVRIRLQRGVAPEAGGVRHLWWVPAHAVSPRSRG